MMHKPKPPRVSVLLRCPRPLYERLRQSAANSPLSMNEVLLACIRRSLDEVVAEAVARYDSGLDPAPNEAATVSVRDSRP